MEKILAKESVAASKGGIGNSERCRKAIPICKCQRQDTANQSELKRKQMEAFDPELHNIANMGSEITFMSLLYWGNLI
jgi:hypothetical protein